MIPASPYGPYTFTPQHPTFSASDTNGRLESKYNYGTSPGTYSWRYNVNPLLCTGDSNANATSDIYNNGGLVPNTHYSKVGVSPCYGFHAAFHNSRINTFGNYQLRGKIVWTRGGAVYTLTFTFNFVISDVLSPR